MPQPSKYTTDPTKRFDKNRQNGRRACDLFKAHMAQMGNPKDVILQAHAMTASEARAIAEEARRRLMSGEPTKLTADTVVKLENFANRAEKKLEKAKAEQRTDKKPRTLTERLALRKAEASA